MKKFIKNIILFTIILTQLLFVNKVYALNKDENVYAKLDEEGNVKNVSIREHLYNYKGNSISEKSKLIDIKNINGNEKYNKKGNNLIWESNGNDIYYEGSYNESLPISIKAKYYFNGEEKDVKSILGQKGKIKIVLTYSNNSNKLMYINGKKEKIYTPYMIVTTTILNNSDNRNIKVTNGKVVDNGLSSIIMAISSPGLYESLNMSKLKNTNKVEISYDTDDFELGSIYFVASTDIFEEDNTNMFNEINKLYKSIDLLQDNMNTIVSASKKLNTGTKQMDDGITELNSKIQALVQKYKYYRNQDRNTLKEELIKIVEKNINKITPELEKEITNETSKVIKDHKDELEKSLIKYTKENTKYVVDEEVKKIVKKLNINTLMEQVIKSNLYNTLKNDKEVLEITKLLQDEINKDLKQIILNEFNKINNSINVDMSQSEKEEYINNIANKYGVTYEQASLIVNEVQSDTVNQVKKNINEANIVEDIIKKLNSKDYLSSLVTDYVKKLNKIISDEVGEDTTIEKYASELKSKIMEALNKDLEESSIYLNTDVKEYISSLVDKIIDNTAKDISSRYTEEYTNEVVKNVIEKEFNSKNVDSKLRELLDIYEDDIDKKVTMLDDTIDTLSSSLNKLNDGSKQISNGMNALSNGLDKYNKEGINKINKLVNGNVKTLQGRVDALIKLSNQNKSIDIVSKNTKSNSKMIFMIDSMSKEKPKVETKKVENNTSLWDKIKGLFD